jgi:cell volume regulation protein A
MLESMNLPILIGSTLIIVSVFTSLISFRFGAPLLLVFLMVGLLAGEDGIGGIAFDNSEAAYFIGSIALAIILFDSGFETRLTTLRLAALPAILLATAGVLLTAIIVGLAAEVVFGLSWLEGLLLGAIVAPTDAAAVFFLLRVSGINLRDRVRSTLEVESGLNDPVAILLTLSLVTMLSTAAPLSGLAGELAGAFLIEAGVGIAVGVAGGFAIVQVINRTNFEPALYPIVMLALALFTWAVAGMLGGSGFIATFVAGLIAGNARMRHTAALRRFQQGTTWLSQIAMFLTLGLLATPSQFPKVAIAAVALALFLTLVARPIAVWLCLLPFRFSRYEVAFVSWVGLRGAVSILLAIPPVIAGLPQAGELFNTAFIIVLVSLLLQGWTIKAMASYLGLVVPPRQSFVDRFELELPGRGDHEIVSYVIHPESPVAKGQRIPRWARPSLFIRDGRSQRPHVAGRPRAGDQIYVITTPDYVPLLDRLFARQGQRIDDPRLFGEFVIEPDTRLADLAGAYGFAIEPGDEALTVTELLRRGLAGDIEQGDRVAYGLVDLIVRKVSDEHAIEEVGLALEHGRTARPRIPVFQSWKEIRDFVHSRLGGKTGEPDATKPDDKKPS